MACRLGKIVASQTAVFLCDMQEKFRATIQYFPEIVEVSSRLLNAAKILDIPVFVTEQYPRGNEIKWLIRIRISTLQRPIVKQTIFRILSLVDRVNYFYVIKKTDDSSLFSLGLGPTVPELGVQQYPDVKPFSKTQFSMLTPDLFDALKTAAPNCKSVVLCGIETHVCIQGTTLALLENGYEVHIVVDACSSRSMVDR